MVGAGDPPRRQQFAGERAQAALHAVAHYCAADLLGYGKTDALGGIAIAAVADEEDEAWGRRSPAAVGGKEVGALAQDDETLARWAGF